MTEQNNIEASAREKLPAGYEGQVYQIFDMETGINFKFEFKSGEWILLEKVSHNDVQ